MSVDRIVRINELLRREIGELILQLVRDEGVDLSAVTVTEVHTARNLRDARVLISIRDHEDERRRILGILERHRPEIQQRINHDLKLKYTPKLYFTLDSSIEKGDRVLRILEGLGDLPEPVEPPTSAAAEEQRNSPE